MKRKLEAVKYSARYALGLFYEPGTHLNLPFKASYLNDDPVFRYIAVDNEKRNRRKLIILHLIFFLVVTFINILIIIILIIQRSFHLQ